MAVETTRIDDVDGSRKRSDDVQSTRIRIMRDGETVNNWAGDLSDANYRKVLDALEFITSHLTNVVDPGDEANEDDAVREWGRANGYDVKDKGRISASVRKAYAAAQASENADA